MSGHKKDSLEQMLGDFVNSAITGNERAHASMNWRAAPRAENNRRVSEVESTNPEIPNAISSPPSSRPRARPALHFNPPARNVGQEPLRQPYHTVALDDPTFGQENFRSARNKMRREAAIARTSNGASWAEQAQVNDRHPSTQASPVVPWRTAPRTVRSDSSFSHGGPSSANWRTSRRDPESVAAASTQLPGHSAMSPNFVPQELVTLGGRRINPAAAERMMALVMEGASYSEGLDFQPNRMVLEKKGWTQKEEGSSGKDHRYKGDLGSGSFMRQIDNLPDDLNSALWIKNLSNLATVQDVFRIITVGANDTKAVKLVFMKPAAAAAFLQQTRSIQGLWIKGKKLTAIYNRHGYRANNTEQSRVILVEGPNNDMTFAGWDEYFRTKAEIQWEGYRTISVGEKRTMMEFRFVRVDGQAQTCLQAILADRRWQDGSVTAAYGPDPCDPVNPQVHLN